MAVCGKLAIIFYNTFKYGTTFIEKGQEDYRLKQELREKALLVKLEKKHDMLLQPCGKKILFIRKKYTSFLIHPSFSPGNKSTTGISIRVYAPGCCFSEALAAPTSNCAVRAGLLMRISNLKSWCR